jgi:hypothetical protein
VDNAARGILRAAFFKLRLPSICESGGNNTKKLNRPKHLTSSGANQMSHVISFPSKPSINDLRSLAMGRNRTAALGAIIPRLKELRSRALKGACIERRHYGDGSVMKILREQLQVGRLFVYFIQMEPGVYFSVSLEAPASRVMTGYFDYVGLAGIRILARSGEIVAEKSKFPPGVHVMSWKRGLGRLNYLAEGIESTVDKAGLGVEFTSDSKRPGMQGELRCIIHYPAIVYRPAAVKAIQAQAAAARRCRAAPCGFTNRTCDMTWQLCRRRLRRQS